MMNDVSWLRVEMTEVAIGQQIGVGTTKSIFEGTYHGDKVAVLRIRSAEGRKQAGLPREAAIYMQIGQHPNLLHFVGIGQDYRASSGQELTLLTEFAPLGSLDAVLERRSRDELPILSAVDIFRQMVCGAQHIAAAGFVHTDISTRNVLVFQYPPDSEQVLVKLTDLAGAVRIQKRARSSTGGPIDSASPLPAASGAPPSICAPDAVVAVRYAPPEVLEQRQFSEASDVWSFAVCVWEVFSDEPIPYQALSSDEDVSRAVCSGMRLPQPPRCPVALWSVLQACWTHEPERRPRFAQLLQQLDILHIMIGRHAGLDALSSRVSPSDVVRRFDQLCRWARGARINANMADFVMIAVESLQPRPMPDGVSAEMAQEHFRIKCDALRDRLLAQGQLTGIDLPLLSRQLGMPNA